MPMMQYLSYNKPVLTSEWQLWVIIGVVVIGILSIGIAIWKTSKW